MFVKNIKRSKLIVITGPMFAGKTTELLNIVHSYHYTGNYSCCILKYLSDDRYGPVDEIIPHDKTPRKVVPTIVSSDIKSVFNTLQEYDVIGITEAQFFPDIELVDSLKRIVVCEGLSGDADRKNFGNLYKLYPLADRVVFLQSRCACGNTAAFTARRESKKSQVKFDGEIAEIKIDVGGAEKYFACCRSCYMDNGYVSTVEKTTNIETTNIEKTNTPETTNVEIKNSK